MNTEFVSYEQALELKELGFDDPCFGYYALAEVRDYKNNGLHIRNEIVLNTLNGYRKYDDESQTLAPTFSQAFRWFRDKHNIQSCIKFTYAEHSFEIHFEKLANGEKPPVMVGHFIDSWLGLNLGLFKTYEEAELECLKKLIEIVKNK
jgi:hypothetical protein